MSNPTARTLARRVAQELGQPTNHPGTARLARDLAEPLPIRHQYRWTVEEWKNGGWVRCESVFTWSARSKSFARASVVKNAPAMRRARFRVHSPVDVGVPEGMELDPSPVRGTGWPSWRVEDHAGEYANVARDLADALTRPIDDVKHLPSCNPRRFDNPSLPCSCGATRPIDPAPHDPEPFCEATGPMPAEELRYYSLVEKTDGPHKGKVWRSEWKTPSEVARINAGIYVMKWEPAPHPDTHVRRCSECDAYPATSGDLCEGCHAYADHTRPY